MRKILHLVLLSLSLAPLSCIDRGLFAQSMLPLIRATSRQVSINDGGYLDKNSWNLSPTARPDVYTADRTRHAKWVTFYTDIDSIRVKLQPGATFDFIILLNGKDSCYTRIASAIPARQRQAPGPATHDTIPFTLTDNNAICVKSIVNDSIVLDLHFDASSFDFVLTTPNYKKFKPITKVQLGPLSWANPHVLSSPNTARGMDGRFGWNLFEGKCVELDYDHNLLIIHSKRPRNLKGYRRSTLDFLRSYPCAKATIIVSKTAYTGDFIFDTGSAGPSSLIAIGPSAGIFPGTYDYCPPQSCMTAEAGNMKIKLWKLPC